MAKFYTHAHIDQVDDQTFDLLSREYACSDFHILVEFSVEDARDHAQIDFLVITDRAAHVIEVKMWRGRVSGGINSDCWTIRHGASEDSRENPIQQARREVRNVRGVLGDRLPVFIYVYFPLLHKKDLPKDKDPFVWIVAKGQLIQTLRRRERKCGELCDGDRRDWHEFAVIQPHINNRTYCLCKRL